MTTTEAKKDCQRRLTEAGIQYEKLTAKTVNLVDLCRSAPVFVTIHGANMPAMWREKLFRDAGQEKPYIVNLNKCKVDGRAVLAC